MHLATTDLLPFSMPAGMKREPHTASLHAVDDGPLAWKMVLFFPGNPRGTGPKHFGEALVGQLFPLVPKVLAS